MKEILLMYANYMRRADASVLSLLEGLSPALREAERKSYYGSLMGLAKHVLGGTLYIQGLFRASQPRMAKLLVASGELSVPEKADSPAAWEAFKTSFAAADRATLDLVEGLREEELELPIALDWYGGEPATVPFFFLFNQLIVHGVHHRGQISQILDELGVEHDFSGIDVEFLPK